jgi:hypothetical protein
VSKCSSGSDAVTEPYFHEVAAVDTGGTCVPVEDIVHEIRLDHKPDVAARLYRAFAMNFGRGHFGDYWALPAVGVLSSISVAMQYSSDPAGKWRPVVSASRSRSSSDSIDKPEMQETLALTHVIMPGTTPTKISAIRSEGRSAAAFANAACQQLGYKRAAVVTTCRALWLAMQNADEFDGDALTDLPRQDEGWWANNTHPTTNRGGALFSQLCPEFAAGVSNTKTCPRWLEVRSDYDRPIEKPAMLDWVFMNSRDKARESNATSGESWWLANRRTPHYPMPESSSCSGDPRESQNIGRCFSEQLADHQQVRRLPVLIGVVDPFPKFMCEHLPMHNDTG